jgi:hypothetical protein
MTIANYPPPPRQTANPAPIRPANSVRRTSSIDVSWPGGENEDRLFVGRVRDYRTGALGCAGELIEEAEFRARLAHDKTINRIETTPPMPEIQKLVGTRGGNHLRLAIMETMPDLLARGAPVYLALDDISGSALVSAFAWSQWDEGWMQRIRESMSPEQFDAMLQARVNVCWGLKEGHGTLIRSDKSDLIANADAGDLRNPADPQGWHALPDAHGPAFRRARRIDVTRDMDAGTGEGLIRIDAAFQDSSTRKHGGRIAIHEYTIAATADAATLELLTLEPSAHVLPYPECPGAVHNTQRLIGSRLDDIRASVLDQLRGPQGCTHLNDALRALAEVPKLAHYLDALEPA